MPLPPWYFANQEIIFLFFLPTEVLLDREVKYKGPNRPKLHNKTNRKPTNIKTRSPKEKRDPTVAPLPRSIHLHVLKPQPPKRRVSDTGASSSHTARVRRRGHHRTFTGVTRHQLHPIQRSTLIRTKRHQNYRNHREETKGRRNHLQRQY